jgi:undecaprenyl-diphosphatase
MRNALPFHFAIMPLFQVVILSIIQGVTEFLPVSSTAHLALAPWLLGWADQGLTFDIALHAGTLLAALLYFCNAWVQIIAQGFGLRAGKDPALRDNPRMLWLLAVGSIPVGVAGFIFGKQAESTWRNPFVMGTMMILVGLLMWMAERSSARGRDLAHVTLSDSIVVGLAQAAAVVPGVSRSGITIAAALFRNLDRVAAARFSFLLAAPAIAGAAAKAFYDLNKHGGIPADMRTPFMLGIALSAASGFAVIAFFLRFLQHRSLKFFIYYRIIFGIIVIALAASRPPAG